MVFWSILLKETFNSGVFLGCLARFAFLGIIYQHFNWIEVKAVLHSTTHHFGSWFTLYIILMLHYLTLF